MSDERPVDFQLPQDMEAYEVDVDLYPEHHETTLTAERPDRSEDILYEMFAYQQVLHDRLRDVSGMIYNMMHAGVRIDEHRMQLNQLYPLPEMRPSLGLSLPADLPFLDHMELDSHERLSQSQQATAMDPMNEQADLASGIGNEIDGDNDGDDAAAAADGCPPVKKSLLWTRAEEVRLRAFIDQDMTFKQIESKMPGRSEKSLQHRLKRLDFQGYMPEETDCQPQGSAAASNVKPFVQNWTRQEVYQLAELKKKGYGWQRIAQDLAYKTAEQCQEYWRRGLSHHQGNRMK